MNRASSRAAIFYVGMGLLLLVLVTKFQANFLPSGLSSQIGHNSESVVLAIVVAAEIQLLRGRRRTPALLVAMVVIAFALIGLGLLLKDADLRSSIVTLNEPLIGSGFVLLYLCLPRSRATAITVAVLVALYVVIFYNTDFVVAQAESLVAIALAGPALDIFDRTILQPTEPDEPGLRIFWMALLLVAVICLIAAYSWVHADLHHGAFRNTIDYLQRGEESFWGWLLIHAYFSYWLGSRWRWTPQAEADGVHQPLPAS
jgi:hypothetical protein